MTILDHYVKEKQCYLKNCTQCGLCAEGCPILPYTDISEISSQDIQQGVFDFTDSGIPNQQAYTKAFACMECFKCTAGMCPEDLNPMLVNELIKGEYISKGLANKAYGDAMQPDSAHRVLASVQVRASDYSKITKPSNKQHARYVFFPGCNVYFQPEKILNAMDILDAIGDDYAFLPGLDYCCGDNFMFLGDIDKGGQQAELLVAAIANFRPESVVHICIFAILHIINCFWKRAMLRYRKFLISVICLSIFAFTISSYAEEEIEDLIDIAESKGKIIAIIEGRKTITFDLRPSEKVLWSGSRGYLGAFLTDQHFFVISTSLNAWRALPLRLDESGRGVASLSPYIALLVTRDRAIGFDATSNRFIETQLPLHDELLAAEVERYVAVVITSSRAFALAAESSAFTEINLRMSETLEAIKLTYSKATVRTSDRLLTFEATGSTWKEHRLY